MIKTLPQTGNASPKAFGKFLFSLALFLFLLTGISLQAQVAANYTLNQLQSTPAYSALTTKTAIHPTSSGLWNDAVSSVPLGFTFNFNGQPYTSVNVSTNGFITFGATAPSVTNYTPISSGEAYDGAVSAFGFDWRINAAVAGTPQPNAVSYYVDNSGGAGNSIFKVEWRAVRRSATDNTGQIDFQIWLYEATGVVEVQFNTQTGAFGNNISGQLGLRGSSPTDFNNLTYGTTTSWPGIAPAPVGTMAAGTASNQLVGIRSAGNRILATSNRTFQWVPVGCIAPSSLAVIAGSTTGNGATITWTSPSPAPANGFQYYHNTTGTPPNGSTTPSGTSATSSAVITTMSGGTSNSVWVRSDCGGSYSSWVGPVTVNTLCSAVTGDYLNYFEEVSSVSATYNYAAPAIQPCHSVQNAGTGNNWYTQDVAAATDGFYDEHLEYNAHPSNAANAWWFTQGVNLTAGTTYQLSYLYGGSTNFSFLTNKMEVKIGGAPHNSFMTTLLDDHPNIKHGAQMNYINFTVSSSGTYYLGFHAYSAANMGKLFLDDVQLVLGVCVQPTGVNVSSLSATAATITWNAPAPPPPGGYAYYLSTSPTPPGNNTTPTGFTSAGTTLVNLAGLTGSTGYYFWVRGNCTGGDFSAWSAVTNFTTPALPPYCLPTTNQSPPAYISNVTTTNAVQNVNNSSAWTSPGYADYTAQTIIEAQGGSFNFSVGLDDGTSPAGIDGGVGMSIFVDWNNDGDFVDAGEKVYNTTSYQSGGTLTGVINVPGGATLGVKRMRVLIDWLSTNPSSCAFADAGELEDYSIKVVVTPPALALDLATSTQCAGNSSPTVHISTGLGSYDTFTWSPSAGVSGTPAGGYTFANGSTVTYTLTATQTSGDFSVNTAQYTYVANPLPTAITITSTPTGAAMCQGGTAVQLTAGGGVVSGLPILSENFNSGAPGWTNVNNSTGGNTAGPTWSIRPDGFAPTGPSWFGTILHSNDATSFMFSDSDLQGSGTNTNVELISPVFSLNGFTAASMSFWHYYRPWTPSTATVEISTNGGGSYTPLPGLVYTNVAQGTPTNFAQVQFDLGAYLGQTNLRIRFKWVATWGWGWAIDNFLVSGNATSAITWSPLTGLYTDAAHTTAYTGGGTTTVYAWPNTTTTYTASASTPSPVCSTTTSQAVTVTPIVAGTISSDQNVCSGNVSNIVLTGQSGTISTWQSSTNAGFTTPTNIPGSAGQTTLTSAMLGPVNTTTYIRVEITNGSCTTYTNYVTLTVDSTTWTTSWSNGLPTAGKRVIFNGTYNSTGTINACSVSVIGGTVTFMPGHSMIVENQVNVTGGQLIFENNASLVQISDAAVNTGAITYKRITTPMRAYDYTYWSSPLSGTTLQNVSPLTRFDKYHEFNAATGQFTNVPNTTVMTAGKGYLMRAPDGWPTTPTVFPATMNMGPANNGVITRPVILSAPAGNLNLIGNPYPSALDADLFLSNPANAAVLNGTLYFWTHNTPITNQQYNNNDYASYNLLGGTAASSTGSGNTSAPTKNIASANAFFVTATANGNVVFNNSMRLAGFNDNFYRPAAQRAETESTATVVTELEKHRIWLNMTGVNGAFKQTLVGYVTNATLEKDRDFDGDAIESMNSINFYSLVEASKLTIQGRPLPFDVYDQVPMGYRANIAGTYSVEISSLDGLFADETQNIYLEDMLLGTIHNLKTGPYSFATAVGEFPGRFVLRYTTQMLQVGDPVFNQNSVIVYENDKVIHINSGNAMMDNVKIFDTRGRLVYEKKNVGSTETQIAHLGAADQVLIVQVTSVDNITVSKKIVY